MKKIIKFLTDSLKRKLHNYKGSMISTWALPEVLLLEFKKRIYFLKVTFCIKMIVSSQ